MPLTPIDVQQKTFATALRGYDLDEVDDFLDEVVTTLRDYEQRLRDAQERIAALEKELSSRGDDESAISRALVAAQKSADSIVAQARADAEEIVASARAEAENLTAQREAERRRLLDDIERMRYVVNDLRSRVRSLATTMEQQLAETEEAVDLAAESLAAEPGHETGTGEEETGGYAEVYEEEVGDEDREAEDGGEGLDDDLESEGAPSSADVDTALADVGAVVDLSDEDEEREESQGMTRGRRPWER